MRFRRSDRIIPARAGFTIRILRLVIWPPDHPRSRGVYSRRAGCAGARPGSSPLARGLHWKAGAAVRLLGIIPARAGFTYRRRRGRRRRPDHPRSRGVYADARCGRWPWSGSSPLARGLPNRSGYVAWRRGIIPARAGFTLGGEGTLRSRWDHPRSRGVYPGGTSEPVAAGGSSPLARGLLPMPDPGQRLTGIIPARAGFTTPTGVAPTSSSDHPRSRGVYPCGGVSTSSRSGSSPLARGLRGASPSRTAPPRIIPARAGFTRIRR